MGKDNPMDTPARQCTATARSGKRCRLSPIPGGTVCRMHGGGAPQVKKTARQRLDALVEPAIAGLGKALESGDVHAVIKASRIVLDRCGFHPSQEIEVTLPGVKEVVMIPASLPAEAHERLVDELAAAGQLPGVHPEDDDE